LLIDNTDDKTGEIVLTFRIKVRHFGRFATEQDAAVLAARAGHSLDDRCRHVRLELSCRKVIEKKKRPCALDQNIVDAVVHEVGADRVVFAGLECDLELCPDAVGRGYQNRLGHLWKSCGKHPAKRADLGKRPFIKGRACKLAYFCDRAVGVIDRNTRVRV
jgi:hypothetical protein